MAPRYMILFDLKKFDAGKQISSKTLESRRQEIQSVLYQAGFFALNGACASITPEKKKSNIHAIIVLDEILQKNSAIFDYIDHIYVMRLTEISRIADHKYRQPNQGDKDAT